MMALLGIPVGDQRRDALAEAYRLLALGTSAVDLVRINPASMSVHFRFAPQRPDWPLVDLSMMATNWRLLVIDQPGSYCAHWCYGGVGMDTFLFAVARLAAWGGDPTDEPQGYISKRDNRAHATFWPRAAGLQLLRPYDGQLVTPP